VVWRCLGRGLYGWSPPDQHCMRKLNKLPSGGAFSMLSWHRSLGEGEGEGEGEGQGRDDTRGKNIASKRGGHLAVQHQAHLGSPLAAL